VTVRLPTDEGLAKVAELIGKARTCAFLVLAETAFPVRFEEIMSGNDPSFFYRMRGPAIAGVAIMEEYPSQGPPSRGTLSSSPTSPMSIFARADPRPAGPSSRRRPSC
jgi:hypothetical protein